MNLPVMASLLQWSLTSAAPQVWGTSVKHSRGQKVGLSHVLADEECVPSRPLPLLSRFADLLLPVASSRSSRTRRVASTGLRDQRIGRFSWLYIR